MFAFVTIKFFYTTLYLGVYAPASQLMSEFDRITSVNLWMDFSIIGH